MRPMYSPRMPRQMSCTPPRNRMEITTVGNPGPGARPILANCSAKSFCTSVNIAPKNAKPDTHRPRYVARRSGMAEKENRLSIASLKDFLKVYCGSPAARSARSNSTEVCRQCVHHGNNFFVEQTKIAGVALHRQGRQFPQQPVKAPRENPFHERVAPFF